MMSFTDYAEDVNLTVEEVKSLCDKVGITYDGDDYLLTEDDIILLDNELQDQADYVANDDTNEEDDAEVIEKAEKLAYETNIDLDNQENFQKLKSRVVKKAEAKNNFLKERKKIYKHREKLQSNDNSNLENVVLYKEGMTIKDFAEELDVNPTEIVKKVIALGVMANVNQSLDFETFEIVASDYNKELKKEEASDISNFENYEIVDKEEDLVERPPVVTIMGHVDHGKTTLLDTIRKTNVALGEAGGITQAIGAYSVDYNGRKITFIDTPGHEAFTEMRARGTSVTDVVIIIVAADDGVKPQTIEAIDHAKAAKVPIIVAINKIDLEGANVDRIMTELVEHGLTPEEWGGDTIVSKISAKSNIGIEELLANVLLVADMQELKANPNRYAIGTVIESSKDRQVGSVVTLLIQNGTLRLGDPIVVGTSYGKVRTLKNDLGQNIVEAPPSTPVEVTGISSPPVAGDRFMAFETEKQAKAIASERATRQREEDTNKSGMSLDDLFSKIQSGVKEINVIVKADVNGSSEAVKNSLEKIDIEGVKINIIRSTVGAITESDVVLASASKAIIIGFNVRANAKTSDMAKEYGVEIRYYDIIYKVIEDMEDAMKGMLDPEYEEKLIGTLEIRQIFKFSKVGLIAGCHVLTGTIKINSNARIVRDGTVIYNGKVKTLQREKDQAKEVKKDMDCGLTLENCQDYKEKDIIEVYELVEIKR